MTGELQHVHFRLIQCPDCQVLLCWVNPRLPNYCPECGKFIFTQVKGCVLTSDTDAWLKYAT